MTLTQLRIFVAVAELGHVTKAAEMLGITQSAASASIASFEAQYDVKLFNRIGRAIEVSDTGRLFLSEAQAVLGRAQAAERALRELSGTTVGHLEIAASQTIANYWLPRRIARFHAAYPHILLNVVISNTREVEAAVVSGHADIGFVEGTTQARELLRDEVDHDQMVMVAAKDEDFAAPKTNEPIDFATMPLVVREPGSGTREMLEIVAATAGVEWNDLNIVLELPSNEAVREAVEAGAGATLISRHVVAASIEGEKLRSLPIEAPTRSFHMLRLSGRQANRAQTAMVDMILAEIRRSA